MPQIFRPYADSAARATLVTLLLGPFAIAGLAGRARFCVSPAPRRLLWVAFLLC